MVTINEGRVEALITVTFVEQVAIGVEVGVLLGGVDETPIIAALLVAVAKSSIFISQMDWVAAIRSLSSGPSL